ncbi:hypothetical protein ACFQX7_28095 [Luedemannella flava]
MPVEDLAQFHPFAVLAGVPDPFRGRGEVGQFEQFGVEFCQRLRSGRGVDQLLFDLLDFLDRVLVWIVERFTVTQQPGVTRWAASQQLVAAATQPLRTP